MSHRKVRLAKTSDLKDGQMKGIEVDDHKILLRRLDGEFFAGVGVCPHYGAPLDQGALSSERIVCPWHHAAFDARTGELCEPPAIDSLPQYDVKIDGDDVYVMLPETLPTIKKPAKVGHDPSVDKRTFVILGAGAAGNAAAETLRNDGFKGHLIMITKEEEMPYDRPDLTKMFLRGQSEEDQITLRDKDFYNDRDIELMTGKRARGITSRQRRVDLEGNEEITYDCLLIAVGGQARKPGIPGVDLENVFTIRSLEDAGNLVKAAEKAGRAVVVGASFIGLETASSLRAHDLDVTVVAPEKSPLEKIVGREIGSLLKTRHEDQGTTFRLGSTVNRVEGNGKVERVMINDTQSLDADLVVFGIGVEPASEFLNGIDYQDDGSIAVDEHFRVNENIYAVGDIARFPDWRTGEAIRIEHWRTAEQQGRIAALNMLGQKTPYRGIPYFWTQQAGMRLRYVGHVEDWDDVVIDRSIDDGRLIAYYLKDDIVRAAVGIGRDAEMSALEELMRLEKMPPISELRDGSVDLVARVAAI